MYFHQIKFKSPKAQLNAIPLVKLLPNGNNILKLETTKDCEYSISYNRNYDSLKSLLMSSGFQQSIRNGTLRYLRSKRKVVENLNSKAKKISLEWLWAVGRYKHSVEKCRYRWEWGRYESTFNTTSKAQAQKFVLDLKSLIDQESFNALNLEIARLYGKD